MSKLDEEKVKTYREKILKSLIALVQEYPATEVESRQAHEDVLKGLRKLLEPLDKAITQDVATLWYQYNQENNEDGCQNLASALGWMSEGSRAFANHIRNKKRPDLEPGTFAYTEEVSKQKELAELQANRAKEILQGKVCNICGRPTSTERRWRGRPMCDDCHNGGADNAVVAGNATTRE